MKKIDLTKLLMPGTLVYSVISAKMMKIISIDTAQELPIEVSSITGRAAGRRYNRFGSLFADGSDPLLFPSKDKQSWEDYSPFTKGDVVCAYHLDTDKSKTIGVYSHKKDGFFFLFGAINEDGSCSYLDFPNCEYFRPDSYEQMDMD